MVGGASFIDPGFFDSLLGSRAMRGPKAASKGGDSSDDDDDDDKVGAARLEPHALKPHQSEGVAFVLARRAAILGDAPSMGKTAQTIAVIAAVLGVGAPATRVLVVAPATVVPVWLAEFRKFLGTEAPAIVAADGDSRALSVAEVLQRLATTSAPLVAVIGYEAMVRHANAFTAMLDLIVFDEAHRLKNPGTKQSTSKKLFRGTTHEHDFVIWHDALSAWWEDEAQDYLATLGFKDRQVCALDDTNAEFARYSHGLVGDSPELMPLDAHLFSDLSQELWRHVAITSNLPESDPRRFSTGTPAEMERSVVRAWQVAPTPDRIVEDRDPEAHRRIIEAKGVAVQDIYFRSSRRYRAANDARDLEHKPRKRQRKATCMEAKPGLGVDTISLPAHTISSRNTSRSGSPSDQRSSEIRRWSDTISRTASN
ncbi:hypothetical protein JL722_5237 [Aureococcus anophagefferens]|nr:hypothetical protein JL722_5237 [Aureococcus anophagefferens]